MNHSQQKIQLRRRKLAALLVDSRNAARRSVEDCAAAMGLTPQAYQAFEDASVAPTLPQLELISLYLDVPLDHFWDKKSLQTTSTLPPIEEQARALGLRDRLLAASLRLARNHAGMTPSDVAEAAGLDEETVLQYESASQSIPLPELEVLAEVLNTPLETFFDHKGPIGKQRALQTLLQEFASLPPETQDFICKPVNRPYLDLAQRLSQMDATRLRAIAESLLEITF
jgi:transcriptional regulator with XRE-family HTH domain